MTRVRADVADELDEVLARCRGTRAGKGAWGPRTRDRLLACLRDVYCYRLMPVGGLDVRYWGGRSREGYRVLRALVDAGWLEPVPVVRRCSDGRRRRAGAAVQLSQQGMDATCLLLGLPPRLARQNRVAPEERERRVLVAELYLALLRVGFAAADVLDSRAAKARWNWPDWLPVHLAVAPTASDPGLAVWIGEACQPKIMENILARVNGDGRWSLLAVLSRGGPVFEHWPPRFQGSVHVVTTGEAVEWGPRVARGSSDWLPTLSSRLAALGLAGDAGTIGPSHPSPLVLRGPGLFTYVCDLRCWDPARVALIRRWSPSPILDEPDELWALTRDELQTRQLARWLSSCRLRVHLVPEAGNAVAHVTARKGGRG